MLHDLPACCQSCSRVSHKCHSCVRHFGRVFALPYRSSPLYGLCAIAVLVCMSLWPVWSTFLSRKSAILTAQNAKFFWPRGAAPHGRRGQVNDQKKHYSTFSLLTVKMRENRHPERFATEDTPLAQIRGPCLSLSLRGPGMRFDRFQNSPVPWQNLTTF